MSSVLANNISSKVVVITGGSSGLGETTARYLASLGASVVLGARRIEKLEAIAADIRSAGGKVAVQATDVTRQDEVKALVNLAQECFGKVDVVINNAGLMAIAPLAETRAPVGMTGGTSRRRRPLVKIRRFTALPRIATPISTRMMCLERNR